MGLRWELTGPDASDFAIEDVEDVNDGKDRRPARVQRSSTPSFESPKGSRRHRPDGTVENEVEAGNR